MRELNIKSVRAIARAVDILNAFTIDKPSLSVDEIVEVAQLPKTTIYRILYTLESVGLIRYDKKTQKYSLGLQILGYAGVLTNNLDVRSEAEDILIDLQTKARQTVIMAVPEGDTLTYVYKRENAEGMKYSSFMGLRRPLHYGVLGHVLMAYLPEEQLDRLVERYPIPQLTKKTITDLNIIKKRLIQIKFEQLFIDRDETHEGGTGIGSPIFDAEGNCIAALGIICPTVQLKEEMVNDLVDMIRIASNQISLKMGYNHSKGIL